MQGLLKHCRKMDGHKNRLIMRTVHQLIHSKSVITQCNAYHVWAHLTPKVQFVWLVWSLSTVAWPAWRGGSWPSTGPNISAKHRHPANSCVKYSFERPFDWLGTSQFFVTWHIRYAGVEDISELSFTIISMIDQNRSSEILTLYRRRCCSLKRWHFLEKT